MFKLDTMKERKAQVEAEDGSADKERTILRSAASAFARNGFSNTTMEDIAKRAGVAKGTLYLYFKSKHDLFTRMVIYMMSRVCTMIEGRVATLTDPWEKLECAMDTVFTTLQKYKETALLSDAPKSLSGGELTRIREEGFTLVTLFESIIVECQNAAPSPDRLNPRVLAMTLVNGLAAYAHGWGELKTSLPPPDDYLGAYKMLIRAAIPGLKRKKDNSGGQRK